MVGQLADHCRYDCCHFNVVTELDNAFPFFSMPWGYRPLIDDFEKRLDRSAKASSHWCCHEWSFKRDWIGNQVMNDLSLIVVLESVL